MSTCKDCLHFEVCKLKHRKYFAEETDVEYLCNQFKPKADYAPVVRCKDCKHWERLYYRPFVEPRDDGRCRALWQFHGAERYTTLEDHFCSYGERKESEVQGE